MTSTKHAAEAAGISLKTLNQWISRGWFKAPPVRLVGGRAVRVWTKNDIKRLQVYKAGNFLGRRGLLGRLKRPKSKKH